MKFRALLLVWLLVALAWAARAQQQTNLLTGNVGNYGLSPQSGVSCTLTLLKPSNRTVGTTFVRKDPVPVTTATDGSFAFTNIQWGRYVLNIGGASGGTDWTVNVQTNTLGTVPLASLADPSAVLPPNPATNYYTMSQVDALVGKVNSSVNPLWSSAGNALYPSGATDTSGGWVGTPNAIYPQ